VAEILRAMLAPRIVLDQQATDAVKAAMKTDDNDVAPIPDVDECPKCSMSFVSVEQGAGLTFPFKVICTCRTCSHVWERLDE
jgi:hypothetical protein